MELNFYYTQSLLTCSCVACAHFCSCTTVSHFNRHELSVPLVTWRTSFWMRWSLLSLVNKERSTSDRDHSRPTRPLSSRCGYCSGHHLGAGIVPATTQMRVFPRPSVDECELLAEAFRVCDSQVRLSLHPVLYVLSSKPTLCCLSICLSAGYLSVNLS